MPKPLRLSVLVNEIQEALENRFEGEDFWITAEITDVKKYSDKRWCFLKFIEKEGKAIITEIKGVFWGGTYYQVEKFEQQTRQLFSSGLEITCLVRVRFHQRYGLTLEVLEIDFTYALGKLELDRQEVLTRLVWENPESIQLIDGQYTTLNNSLLLPMVMQHIALITAPGSDGQRDFLQEIEKNRYGYRFVIREFLVQIQGDRSSELIAKQLKLIENSSEKFDAVVIVRGGGSQTDFKPFDDYELSKYVASFPVPVLTGIGHDRNTSIVDMMARAYKTPTKVAGYIIDHNFSFEQEVIELQERFFSFVRNIMREEINNFYVLKEGLAGTIANYLQHRKTDLKAIERLVKSLSPSSILSKGFAIVTIDDRIITDPLQIKKQDTLKTILKTTIIHSTVTEKTPYENQPDL
ncbi:MAG TPA: exodeoxyribonuclease VII large subunit [Chitinophagales bacterium]|nr:exodeoxyribonuclease VII large subunit [Chitinophagales bacterium]